MRLYLASDDQFDTFSENSEIVSYNIIDVLCESQFQSVCMYVCLFVCTSLEQVVHQAMKRRCNVSTLPLNETMSSHTSCGYTNSSKRATLSKVSIPYLCTKNVARLHFMWPCILTVQKELPYIQHLCSLYQEQNHGSTILTRATKIKRPSYHNHNGLLSGWIWLIKPLMIFLMCRIITSLTFSKQQTLISRQNTINAHTRIMHQCINVHEIETPQLLEAFLIPLPMHRSCCQLLKTCRGAEQRQRGKMATSIIYSVVIPIHH